MKAPAPRAGQLVKIRKRLLEFSLWPVRRGQGGWISNTKLFVAYPWPLIRHAVESKCPKASRKAALAFLEQSTDFYNAAMAAGTAAAKPVLLYYSFLNLAKVLILVRGLQSTLDIAGHGLRERLGPGKRELLDASLLLEASKPNRLSMFDQLLVALRGIGLPSDSTCPVPALLRQVAAGHRLFASASKSQECLITLDRAEILDDGTGSIWFRLALVDGDLYRIGLGQTQLLQRSGLARAFRRVSSPAGYPVDRVWFEQISPVSYNPGWLPNSVPRLVDVLRLQIRQIALSTPPYRTYYLFLSPPAETAFVFPQIISSYAALFYFGSITRYRPHHFDSILRGAYGPFVEAFLQDEPAQLLFLMAAEFVQRDVARAPLV